MASKNAESDDSGINTVNTNATEVEHLLLGRSEEADGVYVFRSVTAIRDVVVLVNRVIGEHGSVCGLSRVSNDVLIVRYRGY